MIFASNDKIQAVEYPLNWGVDYKDGRYLKEFDENGQNDYYSIETDKINRFGLYGLGFKMFYQYDGSFMLEGQLIQIEYHTDEGEIFDLTSSFNKKDCITYKEASVPFKRVGVQKPTIEGICFGYKTIFEKNDTQFYFKPIVNVPLLNNEKVFMRVQLTSNKDLKGKLVFKNKYKVVDEFEGNLKRNYAAVIDWTVK